MNPIFWFALPFLFFGIYVAVLGFYDWRHWGLCETTKDLFFGAAISLLLGGVLLWLTL